MSSRNSAEKTDLIRKVVEPRVREALWAHRADLVNGVPAETLIAISVTPRILASELATLEAKAEAIDVPATDRHDAHQWGEAEVGRIITQRDQTLDNLGVLEELDRQLQGFSGIGFNIFTSKSVQADLLEILDRAITANEVLQTDAAAERSPLAPPPYVAPTPPAAKFLEELHGAVVAIQTPKSTAVYASTIIKKVLDGAQDRAADLDGAAKDVVIAAITNVRRKLEPNTKRSILQPFPSDDLKKETLEQLGTAVKLARGMHYRPPFYDDVNASLQILKDVRAAIATVKPDSSLRAYTSFISGQILPGAHKATQLVFAQQDVKRLDLAGETNKAFMSTAVAQMQVTTAEQITATSAALTATREAWFFALVDQLPPGKQWELDGEKLDHMADVFIAVVTREMASATSGLDQSAAD